MCGERHGRLRVCPVYAATAVAATTTGSSSSSSFQLIGAAFLLTLSGRVRTRTVVHLPCLLHCFWVSEVASPCSPRRVEVGVEG